MARGKFRVIDAELRHLETICELFTAVGAPTACTPEFLLWNFKTPWVGEGPALSMTLVVDEDDRAVSCYGAMVTPLLFFGESRRFAWSGNYLTLPEYRGLGLGGTAFLTHMRKYEVYMAFSPNDMSWPMFRAARFINFPQKSFNRYIYPVDWDQLCSLLDSEEMVQALCAHREDKSGPSPDVARGEHEFSFREVKFFGADYTELWDGCKNRFTVTTDRKSRYMQWRYLDIPYFRYEIRGLYQGDNMIGLCVWRYQEFDGKKVARLCDFLSQPGYEAALLCMVLKEVRCSGSLFMDFYETGLRLRDIFTNQGFIPAEGLLYSIPSLFSPFSPRTWTNSLHVWVKNPADRREELQDISAYYFTKGDADRDLPTMHYYSTEVLGMTEQGGQYITKIDKEGS